jgi:hypothetical protein
MPEAQLLPTARGNFQFSMGMFLTQSSSLEVPTRKYELPD